jgi:chromosome segregation ATPase
MSFETDSKRLLGYLAVQSHCRRIYGASMFSNSRQIKETNAALIAALGERDEYLRQRDIAVSERNAAIRERDDAIVGKLDRLPAAFQLALAERTAYHEQRDRAFRELDAVTSERNQFKVEIERLKRQIAILASSRMHYAPSIGST